MHQLLGKSVAEARGVRGEVGMMLINQSAVLGRHGSRTPLLLSKELMRRLGVVLDMKDDSCPDHLLTPFFRVARLLH